MNAFVNDKIGYGYVRYINDKYFALIAMFVGKYSFSSSDLFWRDAYLKCLEKTYKLAF